MARETVRPNPVRFAKALADDTRQEIMAVCCCSWVSVGEIVEKSIATYCQETNSGVYPNETQCYTIGEEVSEAIRAALEAEALA